jgi:DNA-binding transcriptional LysR family regulator
MVRGLGLRHVEVIYAVMLTGTVTGAAARLNVSQPAISNSVKEAEDRLGFALFYRQHGRIFPTERATAIFAEIERSFTGLDTINSVCRSLRKTECRRLMISATPAWATGVLPRVLHDYMKTYPELRFSVITKSSEYVQSLISSFKADIGFGLSAPPIPGVAQFEIAKARLQCALPPNHPLAERSEIHVTDLATEPLITFSGVEGTDDIINKAFADHDLEPQSVIECPAALAVCAMIEAGIGIGLIHGICAHVFRGREIAYRPFTPQINISMCAYWRTCDEPTFDRDYLMKLAIRHTDETLAAFQPSQAVVAPG